ncbi:TauD/TfdA family dioxygenase [Cupriavidus necator]|uniref:TauD/TfdA dioxygenase family protein n=1 Tax=Cupriavidus necator TaxID=106590 RepID=UPI0039C4D3B3
MTEANVTRPAPAAPAIVRPSVLKNSLKVERVSPALGAEISNVSLVDASQDAELFAEIKALWLKHKVLFFRDQDITPLEQQTFAECFGELDVHRLYPGLPEAPKILPIDAVARSGIPDSDNLRSFENNWHSDTMNQPEPLMGAVLRCVTCPEVGGDTLWANMALAYETLPEHVKQQIEGLYARSSIEVAFCGGMPIEKRHETAAKNPPPEHPVVRIHPETGEKILYVCMGYVTSFTNWHVAKRVQYGQDMHDRNHMLSYLASRATIPEFQVRLRWRPNTVAVWDNRSTQHYANFDYGAQPRRMLRAGIKGDRPV